jgi:glycosyltransferase involved in cell wall biosynthesis
LFWTRICEREAVQDSDLNLTLTEADRQSSAKAYDSAGKACIRVIGVFEYRKDAGAHIHPLSEEPVFIVTGDLSMRQTVEPFLEWMHEYLPILREMVPGAKVIVAGKDPAQSFIRACGADGIEVVESPTDMASVLRRGRYYLCPSSKGSGIKLRVMDGLRSGLPALVHRNAARGYESFEGKGLFVYQDAPSFESALKTMLSSHHSKEEMFRMYQTTFSYESGILRMKDAVESLSER